MKVSELLENLNKLPLNAEVVLSVYDNMLDDEDEVLIEVAIEKVIFEPTLNKVTIVEN